MLHASYREPGASASDEGLAVEPVIRSGSGHGGGPGEPSKPGIELWGGVECTVNRVGERYLDQLEWNGHAARASDLDLFAQLGFKALRYPVLWERTAPEGIEAADWSWADGRLERLRELGIRPIVGLVHHGSGPRDTSLLDPLFPEKLAAYARAVAERYPWVNAYTPVNEITTTARFSAMYGLWYPHARDGRSFAQAMLNQCRATVLAMQAIREVNPCALLVQTDDLGKTRSTPRLAYQAQFDNDRRWLGWDLLCGQVDPEHPLWRHLLRDGVTPAELEWFFEHACRPDIVGVNYYITSERFLDERLERYPDHTHGGNALERYADVETVRAAGHGIDGAEVLLREAWERYRLPVAVTEVHLGCTREEQLRWVLEIWRAAARLRASGVDVRAVTAWSLLGAYDWDSLLTRAVGSYEPGVFDLRGGVPRPTALAGLLRELGAGREPDHPVLSAPGWWRRPERMQYPPADGVAAAGTETRSRAGGRRTGRTAARDRSPLVITGATGTLGRAFARMCRMRGLPYRLLRRQDMDITAPFMVEDLLDEVEPWAVVNTAGYVRVDDAEADAERCFRENAEGPEVLAAACARRGVPLVTFSSDLVFDGEKREPYVEGDLPLPLNVYGRSKAEAESRVLAAHPGALVVRASAFFGPWDSYNFVTVALRELSAGRPFAAMDDAVVSPTYVPHLVNATLDLLIDGECGIWHLANPGAVTWLELARMAAERAGVDASRLEGRPTESFQFPARRPSYSVLGSQRGVLLPPLDAALARYFHDREGVLDAEDVETGRTDCLSWSPAVFAPRREEAAV